MIDRLLQIHLEPVARAERRARLLKSLAVGWLTVAGTGLFFILLHRATGSISPWPFVLLGLAALIWTFFAWRRSRRGSLDFQTIARNIEAENPKLHTLLLTAVEQQPDATTHELNYLQDRVIREALAEDRNSLWRQRAAKRLHFAQLGSVAALALLAIALANLYHAAPPRLNMLASLPLIGREVSVTPGDTSIEKGGSLVVLAKFGGEVPAEAVLVVRPANEPERRIPLMKNLDDPIFGTSVPDIKDALTYRIEYGGETTRDFRVSVFEYPRLERADAKVTYPEYTGLAEKTIEDTRRVSAVEGSALGYTFHLNKPVQSAQLVPVRSRRGNEAVGTGNQPDPLPHVTGYTLLADTNRPNVYLASFTLERSGRYELILVDDAGRTNKVPPLFVLDALTNRAPELKFAFPRGDQRVSALEEIAFQVETSDDFGLKAYGFAYNLAGQETKFVELGRDAEPHEKRAFNHLVALEDLGAQVDQLLSYYLWADDIGPDGSVRRTASDMFFAEVRPFEEIFREGQAQDPNQQQQQQQQQGQQGQNQAERLAELQKQIITATWNIQRRGNAPSPSPDFKKDVATVKESQENALEQVRSRLDEVEDPRTKALLQTVETEMVKAVERLAEAMDDNSTKALSPALSSEQSAYQALLRMASRETQVAQGQPGQQGQSSRGQRAQRQLDQLNLRQSENRYQTERQAAPPQNPQEREQLQAFNRLKELAQRQQDVNERLRELQAALQAARTEQEREELRQQLKRLQEEQQQMLADVDELRQRMERPENQSQMAEARQQLDQTREQVQQAADAMQRGETSQALSSGTRAQRELQEMRDDFRRQNSSQFAEDMRDLRSQARELSQQQEQIGQQLDALNQPGQRRTLTDSDERRELASQLDEQKQRMEELVRQATEVTQRAEPVEPLLSRQLYDTLRRATQDEARNLQETTEDLLSEGRMFRNVYDRLQTGRREGRTAVEVTADLLREGYAAEANNLEQRARRSINELRTGVERAAESVLGDDTEALRLARSELDELNRQLERELAQAQRGASTNRAGSGRTAGRDEAGQQELPGWDGREPRGDERQRQAQNESQRGQGQQQAQNQSQQGSRQPGEQTEAQGQRGGQPGQQAQSGQRGQGGEPQEGSQPGQRGQGQGGQQELASANQPRGGNNPGQGDETQPGQRDGNRQAGGQRGGASFLDQFGGDEGGSFAGGPITGAEFTQWSDRLRDVEEMLDVPELRAEAARIRDRARAVRQDLRRHSVEPQWDLVRMQIAGPLVELRTRVAEELARRESKEALVPIDRDPVPTRYSELVRRYYEQLGRSESGTASDAKPGSFE